MEAIYTYFISNYDAIVGCLVVFEGMMAIFVLCKGFSDFFEGFCSLQGTLLVHEQAVSTKCDQHTVIIANQRELIFGGQDVPTVYMYMT